MYAYFDDTKRFWNKLLIIYLLTFPCYICFRFFHFPIWFTIFVIFVVELVGCMGIIQHTINMANAHMKEMEDILYTACDPVLFQQKVNLLLEKKVRNRTQQCILSYELMIAYIAQGLYAEAKQVFTNICDDVALLTYDKRWPIYVLMCYIYTQLGNRNDAYTMLLEGEQCFQKTKTRTPFPAISLEAIKMYLSYHLENGDREQYRAYVKRILKEEQHTNLYENMLYYELLCCAKDSDSYKEEIMCAYYIVKHGNQLMIVEEAKKSLERSL